MLEGVKSSGGEEEVLGLPEQILRNSGGGGGKNVLGVPGDILKSSEVVLRKRRNVSPPSVRVTRPKRVKESGRGLYGIYKCLFCPVVLLSLAQKEAHMKENHMEDHLEHMKENHLEDHLRNSSPEEEDFEGFSFEDIRPQVI